jgi:K+/H+ antiporter YhaU regulatory subunit KhtT
LLLGRFLLPAHTGSEDPAQHFRLEDYLTEITLLKDSPLLDKTIQEIEQDPTYHFQAVGLVRKRGRMRAPYSNEPLQEGDVVVVRTTPEELVSIRKQSNLELHPVKLYGSKDKRDQKEETRDGSELFVQAVVAPRSDLVGRTDFGGGFSPAVWRDRGWSVAQGRLAEPGTFERSKCAPNDVLVLEGDQEGLARVANDNAFLMLVPFHAEPKCGARRGWPD